MLPARGLLLDSGAETPLQPQRKTTVNKNTSPRTDDAGIEHLIQAKGKTAARITPSDLQANIVGEYYFTARNGVQDAFHLQDELTRQIGAHAELDLLTFCVLVLKNSFTVTGESACASPENFDAEIGRKIARQNAEQKIWPLLGFLLKEKLHAENSLARHGHGQRSSS